MERTIRAYAKRARIRWYSDNAPTALNVLFFGSDRFSVHSLNALRQLREENPGLINKLQVVTRRAKKCGRNLSQTREVPIVKASSRIGLPPPINCDSTKDMLGPVMKTLKEGGFNMIVAVSFGKLISRELIAQVPYTLNVHPSLLPQYKGSSPIQHTLLNGDVCTGVSVQTLHPEKFDHGNIIAQTNPLKVSKLLETQSGQHETDPNTPPKVARLMDSLGSVGGKLLAHVLRDRLYEANRFVSSQYPASYAPKITTEMRQVHWGNDSACDALRKFDSLGPLYTFKQIYKKNSQVAQFKRVIFHHLAPVADCNMCPKTAGEFEFDSAQNCLLIPFTDGKFLKCTSIQFEGHKIEAPDQFIKSLRKRCGELYNTRVFSEAPIK
ncbi:LAQU0S07e03642g1_1 [Lachancea quebecensis]|uniref:Methionyl-tRNA formyltransferase, mitochondrial n=1 Tax=Lachancea quebecensis TaxID=1654605 RepID=A0A0P1KZL9_9SACH|nr:LAQU0S07e03642g1_1 [Lachancea quebecensis]